MIEHILTISTLLLIIVVALHIVDSDTDKTTNRKDQSRIKEWTNQFVQVIAALSLFESIKLRSNCSLIQIVDPYFSQNREKW